MQRERSLHNDTTLPLLQTASRYQKGLVLPPVIYQHTHGFCLFSHTHTHIRRRRRRRGAEHGGSQGAAELSCEWRGGGEEQPSAARTARGKDAVRGLV